MPIASTGYVTIEDADTGITVLSRWSGVVMRKGEPMDDSISRQAAIDLFPNDALEWDTKGGYIAPHLVRRMIKELPPAQPERKKGKWEVYYDDEYPTDSAVRCSNCHAWFVEESAAAWEYCPHCGATMRGE